MTVAPGTMAYPGALDLEFGLSSPGADTCRLTIRHTVGRSGLTILVDAPSSSFALWVVSRYFEAYLLAP